MGTTETAMGRRNRPASRYLMPLAFGSLIGATITRIGTSPNILIAQVRARSPGSSQKTCDRTT
jgi:di/tricarboxylate transporter